MFTNTQLEQEDNPILLAYELQEKIQKLQMELASLNTEYQQVILYCKEKQIQSTKGYSMIVKRREMRRIDPALFKKEFPNENAELVSKQAAFLGSELDKLVETKILPSINIKDAEKLVGNTTLNKACTVSVTESISIAKMPEE